jgi:hypothetical protein
MDKLSGENQTLIQAAIQAVNIQLSPSATPTERMNAGKYCEDLKKDVEGIQMAFLLMHPSLDGPVRMYGLSILEYHVKHTWEDAESGEGGSGGHHHQKLSKLTPKQKASLQTSMVNMMAMGTREILEEEAYVKEKACVVMVEMAKRSWPQEWPSLLPALVETPDEFASTSVRTGFANASSNHSSSSHSSHPPISSLGATQLELVVSFFRILAEEIGSPLCELPNARRKMMIHTLTHLCATSLFPSWFSHLDFYYGVYREAREGFTDAQIVEMLPGGSLGTGHLGGAPSAAPNPALAQQAATLQTAVLIIHGILQALVAFAEWMKLEVFLGKGEQVEMANQKSKMKNHGRQGGGVHQDSAGSGWNLAEVVVLFLGEGVFRLKAAELLLVMVSRPRPERDHMMFLFEHMETMSEALNTVPPLVVMEEVSISRRGSHQVPALSFSRRLCQTFCILGQIYLDFLNINKPPPNLDMFMGTILNISSHPSLQLSSLTSSFWKRMLSLDQFQKQPYFISTVETLLGNMSWNFVKWQFDTTGSESGGVCPSELHFFRTLDFEDDEETYISFQAENRGLLSRSLLVPSVLLLPATALSFANFQWNQCASLFRQTIQSIISDPSQQNGFSMFGPILHQNAPDTLSALISMFESACHVISTFNDHLSPASMGFPMEMGNSASQDPEILSLYSRGSHPIHGADSTSSSKSQKRKKKGKKGKLQKEKDSSSSSSSAPLLQTDDASTQLIFETSGQLLLSLIEFESGIDEITAVQIDGCKSFLSYFYCQPEALDALLNKLLSLVVYFGAVNRGEGGVGIDFADPASYSSPDRQHQMTEMQRAVAQAQMAFDGGDYATCGGMMGGILNSLQISTKLVRRKACGALIHIASKIPSAMVGRLSEILAKISEWTNRNLISGQEIILLMDWVSSLSNAMDQSEQESLLGGLISPQVVQWQDEFFCKATSSPLALLAFSGALPRHSKRQRKMLGNQQGLSPYDPSLYSDLPAELVPQSPEASSANRQSLSTLMQSLEAVWRRASNIKRKIGSGSASGSSMMGGSGPGNGNGNGSSGNASGPSNLELYNIIESNPLSHFDMNILPNLLRLIACLHQMWRDDIKDRYDESCKGAYELNAHMVSTWLRRHGSSSSSSSSSGGGGDGGHSSHLDGGGLSDDMASMMVEESYHVGGGGGGGGDSDVYGYGGGYGPQSSSIHHDENGPQSVWNTFFSQTRSSAYTILGFIISHQTPFWTDSADLLDSFAGAILTDIDSAHPYDLSQLIKKVVLPAIRTCPPHAFEHIQRLLEPCLSRAITLVSQLYKSKADKERVAAAAVAQAAAEAAGGRSKGSFHHGGAGGVDYDSHQSTEDEIIMDRSIVDLLTSVSTAVQTCILRCYSSRASSGNLNSDSSSDSSTLANGPKKNSLSYISPLSDFFINMLRMGNGSSHWILLIINDILAWDENISTRRMCHVLSQVLEGLEEAAEERLFAIGPVSASKPKPSGSGRASSSMGGVSSSMMGAGGFGAANQAELLQSALIQNPMLPPEDPTTTGLLANDTFKTILLCLHRQSENAGMLISLARDLYALDPESANRILMEIPNITHTTINKFNTEMSHQSTEKGKSGVLRDLLEKEAGWDLTPATSSATHATRILDVPAPLFAMHMAKRQKAAKEKNTLDEYADSGLRSLFGSP